MTDTLSLSNFTGLTEAYAASAGTDLSTGDLRRRYNFGSMVTELAVDQTPFFRLASQIRREPTDDPQFKFTEERPSFHKRYAYVVGHATTSACGTTTDATVTATNIAQGDTYYFLMKTDYKNTGNIRNSYDEVSSSARTSAFSIGATGTQPKFFLANQLVRIPFGSAYNVPDDYIIIRVLEATSDGSEGIVIKGLVVRTLRVSTNNELQWLTDALPMSAVYAKPEAITASALESKRSYVCGTAFAKGSGYPETWLDNPYSTGYGLTQIWKTALGMDNTSRATVLKYAGNEWARVWAQKLIHHKWDIEDDLWFGSQYTDVDGIQYTQGIVDYVLQYGNLFDWSSTMTADDFLDDLSQYLDPRLGNSMPTVFFTDTYTYNWMNKLSGYFNNNIQISPNFRADFAFKGMSNALGIAVNKISTIYGDINVVRDVHLDGKGINIVGVNMNYIKWRPLVGNGINRDTAVYVGVQTLENSGVDKRVDLILTEGGLEIQAPERHAIWK